MPNTQQHPENPWGTTGFEPGGTKGEAWNLGYEARKREENHDIETEKLRVRSMLEMLKRSYIAMSYCGFGIDDESAYNLDADLKNILIYEMGEMEFREWEEEI